MKIKKIKADTVVNGISSQMFVKHFPVFLMATFFALAYISERFDCMAAQKKLLNLTTQLEITRADVQRERSHYMSSTCESSMQAMVDSLNLGLKIQEQPPYKLSLHNGSN